MLTTRFSSFVLIIAALLLAPATLAQDFDLSWHTVDGGGAMSSTGGGFELSGTIGQPDAGEMTGGDFTLSGGFWPVSAGGTTYAVGDLNCDGVVDLFDIDPFVLALTSVAETPPFGSYGVVYPNCNPLLADVNNDSVVDLFDIDSFVALLTGP